MNIKSALEYGAQQLKDKAGDRSFYEARLLLAECMSKSQEFLLSQDKESVPDQVFDLYQSMIERRQRSEPVAYILGKKEFYGRLFQVDQNVLIPRPETEGLVEWILEDFKSSESHLKILDLATGSGCIAITLALELRKPSQVFALDISESALAIAKFNAKQLKVSDIHFFQDDIRSPRVDEDKFDILVSNPPYIPSEDLKSLEPDILHFEPLLALDGGQDGLSFYKILLDSWFMKLKVGGFFYMETFDEAQRRKIRDWISNRKISIMERGPHMRFERLM